MDGKNSKGHQQASNKLADAYVSINLLEFEFFFKITHRPKYVIITYFSVLSRFFQSWSHTVEAEWVTATRVSQISSLRSLKLPWNILPKLGIESHLGCQRVHFHRRNSVCQNSEHLKRVAKADLPVVNLAPPSSLWSNPLHVTRDWAVSARLTRYL